MSLHADNVIETKGALILGAGAAGLFTALKLSPYPALVLADGKQIWFYDKDLAQANVRDMDSTLAATPACASCA